MYVVAAVLAALFAGARYGAHSATRAGATEVRDAQVKLAGLARLDSAQDADNRWLRSRLRAADSAYRANVATLQAKLAASGRRIDSIIAAARPGDTVYVPVEVLVEAKQTYAACTDALSSCESKVAAERSLRLNAEEQVARAEGERDEAKKLIPTPAQHRRHDAKVAAITVAGTVTVLTIVRAALSLLGRWP